MSYVRARLAAFGASLVVFAGPAFSADEPLDQIIVTGSRAPLAISAGLFAATEDFDACGILAYGALVQEKKLGTPFDPMDKGMLDEGMQKLKESVPADKLAELKSRGEKMSLDELVDFALKALSDVSA